MSNRMQEVKAYIWTKIGNIKVEDNCWGKLEQVLKDTNETFNCNIQLRPVSDEETECWYSAGFAWAGIIDGELYLDSVQVRWF